jgi:hypothetical protein
MVLRQVKDCNTLGAQSGIISPQCNQTLLYTRRQRLVSVHHHFWQTDLFEARSHLQIEIEIAIAGWMIFLCCQPLFRRFLRTDAFQDSPGLMQFFCYLQNSREVFAPGKCSAVEKHHAFRVPAHSVGCSLKHHFHAEVVLFGGIFEVTGFEQGMPDLIFAQDSAGQLRSQFPRQRGLPRTGKPCHEHDHREPAFRFRSIAGRYELYFPLSSHPSWR